MQIDVQFKNKSDLLSKFVFYNRFNFKKKNVEF